MKTLIRNGLVIPMTGKNDIRKADILIENNKISQIKDSVEGKFDKIIDADGSFILPSFVNAHTHLAMELMRNFKDDRENLQDWLSEIWPIEAKLNDRDIYWASKLGIAELIRSGCTTFADMYYHAWETAKACRESGIRGILGVAIIGDGKVAEKNFKEDATRIKDAADGYENIRIDAAPHAIYTCSDDAYVIAAEWAAENGALLNTHLSETQKEVDDCIRTKGERPVSYLNRLGIFDRVKTYLAHGVFFDDAELEILRKKDVSIVHNPSSNAKLASGIAPIAKYRTNGMNIALGTDGASSNNNLNMINEMRLASMLSSVSTGKPSALSCYDVIRMATADGAKALGLDTRIGTLEEGKEADLLVMNMKKVNTCPVNDPYSAIVFSSDARNIEYVFSSGEMLLKKGTLTTLDEDEIMKNVTMQWNDILRR